MNNFQQVLLENCKDADTLDINLKSLYFSFESKPLLVGDKAMKYYGIEETDETISFIISEDDYELLAAKYPDSTEELWGDFGLSKHEMDLWKSICLFDYSFLIKGAIETEDFLIISLEKLLFIKTLMMGTEKGLEDLRLISHRMAEINTIMHDYY